MIWWLLLFVFFLSETTPITAQVSPLSVIYQTASYVEVATMNTQCIPELQCHDEIYPYSQFWASMPYFTFSFNVTCPSQKYTFQCQGQSNTQLISTITPPAPLVATCATRFVAILSTDCRLFRLELEVPLNTTLDRLQPLLGWLAMPTGLAPIPITHTGSYIIEDRLPFMQDEYNIERFARAQARQRWQWTYFSVEAACPPLTTSLAVDYNNPLCVADRWLSVLNQKQINAYRNWTFDVTDITSVYLVWFAAYVVFIASWIVLVKRQRMYILALEISIMMALEPFVVQNITWYMLTTGLACTLPFWLMLAYIIQSYYNQSDRFFRLPSGPTVEQFWQMVCFCIVHILLFIISTVVYVKTQKQ